MYLRSVVLGHQQMEVENPALYKSSESVPVLYEPETTAIRKEEDLIQPQATESRETTVPTASLYV